MYSMVKGDVKLKDLVLTSKDFIVKSNYIIEASYRLSVEEQRIIHILTSMIEEKDIDFKKYKFTIKEFAEIINTKDRSIYKNMAIYIDSLRSRDLTIYKEDSILKLKWLSSAEYFPSKGYIELEFSPKLKPYLLQLQKFFTELSRKQLVSFTSQHTGRVYELLKQYEKIKQREITIKDLKKFLGLQDYEYKLYSEIKRTIVKKAIEQINKNTDLNVTYEEIKESRKVVALRFFIDTKRQNEINETAMTSIDEDDEAIKEVIETMNNLITCSDAKSIYKASKEDLDKIRKAYDICKNKEIDNLTGYMIKLVSVDIANPVPQKKKSNRNRTNANFDRRGPDHFTPEYFKNLEKNLLNHDDEN